MRPIYSQTAYLNAMLLLTGLCLALVWLAGAPAVMAAAPTTQPHPPIPIHFNLKTSGFVTLVIEDEQGRRVRNLVSETPFPAGENTAWWDGLDDIGRIVINPNNNAMAPRMVGPGTYRVRGLVRPPINLVYEMTPYTNGNPPWATADKSSEWLANHTPPSAVLFIPAGQAPRRKGKPTSAGAQILVGSYVTEGSSGLAWLDTNGHKLWGQFWIGGVWTGAPYLARDQGSNPVPGVYAYTGSAWESDLRLHELVLPEKAHNLPIYPGQGGRGDTRFGSGEDPPVLSPNFKLQNKAEWNGAENRPSGKAGLAGLAVYNGLLVASVPRMDGLLFIDVRTHRSLGAAPLSDSRGIAFDRAGRLLALSGGKLLRYTLAANPTRLPAPEIVISKGLEDPQQITLDPEGNLYISDRGASHLVKVFSPDGSWLRDIGHRGAPRAGRYNPQQMTNPNGVTIDDQGRLWVAETDYQPKRVSVWTLQGKLVKAFYGPPIYGGGGELDPENKDLFYHHGMTLKLDWKKGESSPVEVLYRREGQDPLLPPDWAPLPQTPFYVGGRKYMTNCYNTNPTNGASYAVIWQIQPYGVATAVAALGRANDVPLFKTDAFRSRWPDGADLKGGWWANNGANRAMFVWNDLNGDGGPQPEEVVIRRVESGGVTVMPDLSFVVSRVDEHPSGGAPSPGARAMRYPPARFSSAGAPRYDLDRYQALTVGVQWPTTSGGDQALLARDGWTVLTTGARPFASQSVSGAYMGQVLWQYPSLWPGLHASHNAPLPQYPGQLIGTTRLLGYTVIPRGSNAGEIWAINGNKGNVYLLTTDGLFVSTLFKDSRTAGWNIPEAKQGMTVNDYSLGEESFWPSITQASDGGIYLTGNTSILRVEGLEDIRRLPATVIQVTPEMLVSAQQYFVHQEAARQEQETAARAPLQVDIRAMAPVVNGNLEDWKEARFVTSDNRASAALAISGDRLYAAFRTDQANLLDNSGESLQNLFKTGGALDLMLDTIPGGERLLVTRVKGKKTAVLYRPRVPGTTTEPVKYTSNIGTLKTITMDRVDDVSEQVQLASDRGSFEFSVPLSLLGLTVRAGQSIKGDIGLLRGSGFQTLQRVYWHNRATGLVSDLASEAELTPQFWGMWQFQ